MSGLFRWVGKEQMLTPSIRDIDQNLSCVKKSYVHRNSQRLLTDIYFRSLISGHINLKRFEGLGKLTL